MEATRRSNHAEAGFVPVMERVAAGAHEAVDKAASAASKAAKMVDRKSGALMGLRERYLDGYRDRVRDNPLAALGVAAAAGLVISVMLRRR